MNVSEYDYEYPESAIALHPPTVRGESKLFVVLTQTGEIIEDRYNRLSEYLGSGDVLVRNITKVFHARLHGIPVTNSGEKLPEIEVFVSEPHAQSLEEYALRNFDTKRNGFVLEFLSAKRKIKLSQLTHIEFGNGFALRDLEEKGDSFIGLFYRTDGVITVEQLFELFEKYGKVPLPPYIKRQTNPSDEDRYQTIFAQKTGSVAAPTASLNFTKELERELTNKKVAIEEVTLHVGRGTFMPLREEEIEKNVLHAEPFYVRAEAIEHIKQSKVNMQRIVAMGTTTTRVLESIAPKLLAFDDTAKDIVSETQLFIYPPYQFKIIDGLLTNFHFPKSSLITLVDAFLQYKHSKLSWRDIYTFAIQHEAKLFSYGDSMLIL